MKDCCREEDIAVLALRAEQRTVLTIVLTVNSALFVVELAAGLVVRSTALLGDSLDMLADALSTASVSTPSLAPSVRALSRRS